MTSRRTISREMRATEATLREAEEDGLLDEYRDHAFIITGARPGECTRLLHAASDIAYWSGIYEVETVRQLTLTQLPRDAVIAAGAHVPGFEILRLMNWNELVRPDLCVVYVVDGSPEECPRRRLLSPDTCVSLEELSCQRLEHAIRAATELGPVVA